MSSSAAPVRSWSSRISSRIWAWIVTSRAVVGSSAMSSFGSHDRAIAIMTRWRIPPDISCGYCLTRRSGLLIPTALSDSTAFSQAAFFDRPWWRMTASAIWSPTVKTGLRLVIGSWKIIAMSLPRTWRISSSESASRSRPSNRISPVGISAGGMSMQPHDRQRGHALAAAGLADEPERLARPGSRSSTPSTARTTPSMTWKYVRRSRTSSRASPARRRCRRGPAGIGRERSSGHSFDRGSRASRRPSPMKLMAMTVRAIAMPGKNAHHQLPSDLVLLRARQRVAPADVLAPSGRS